MSLADIFIKMPWWYYAILSGLSLYYAIRGIMEKKILYKNNQYFPDTTFNQVQKVFIIYIQEFLFKVVITVSGFMALYLANYIFSNLKSLNDIGAGTAIILIFLIMWGITGVSGYLTFLILTGKFPTQK